MKVITAVSKSALLALCLGAVASSTIVCAQEAVAPTAPAATETGAAIAPAETPTHYSKVRIVRLSEVKGDVLLDRNIGRGFETPMTNLPITEGVKLQTGEGLAEIELEDNSSVRVGPNALVEFPRLELLPGGAKASAINVVKGSVYVSLMNTKGNQFTVTFGKESISLPPDSHIRLQMTPTEANLAVLHGEVMVAEPTGTTLLGKSKTMTFNLSNDSQPVVAKNVADQPLDAWDKDASQYHKNFANASSYGNSPYSYGVNDMNYYGSFINAGGCGGGSLWRPYFTSASWDPYGSGAWAYYPSAGYSWVSPYPWGWTPYHSGNWAFCPGIGWGWRPGGNWQGLANNNFTTSPTSPTRPRPPAHPPIRTEATILPVNIKAIPMSRLAANDKFVFRSDSAGLGVPRGTLGKLGSFSNHTEQHGMASTNVYWGGTQRGASGTSERAGAYSARSGSSSSVSSTSSHSTLSHSSSAPSMSSGPSMSSSSMGSHGGGSPAGGGGGRH